MTQARRWQQWLVPIIAICLMIMLLPCLAAAPTTLVYSTDFEDVTKRDAHRLEMGIDNWFEFQGDGGATMWMEGLDRKTPNVDCHSGIRCVGMELTDITKSRRNQFSIVNLTRLVGDDLFVSVWLYLPADWQLHPSSAHRDSYEIVNPYFTGPPTHQPYSAIGIFQDATSPVFDLRTYYRDESGVLHTWDDYGNFPLPRGRWFQVQYYVLRSSTDGALRIWLDGTLITNRSGLQTKGSIEAWFTSPAKIYCDTTDRFSRYRIWVDDLEISKGEVLTVTSVSLDARLDASSNPPTVEISGSIRPAPGRPVNITLKFSDNRGGTYQEMARITSGADGTFSYSWEAPSNDVFIITADAQGAKSPAVSVGIGGFPGFPLESLLVGYALGLLFAMMRRRQRANRPVFPSCQRSQD